MYQKIENNIKIQNQRHLSLKGKAIIINTILLSKLWYVSNVFHIPKDLLSKINEIIFKFLWNNKTGTNSMRNPLSPKRKRSSWNTGTIHTKRSVKNKIYLTTWKQKITPIYGPTWEDPG